jgi:hypothetical protein
VRGGISTSKMASLARRTTRSIAKKQNIIQNSPQVKVKRLRQRNSTKNLDFNINKSKALQRKIAATLLPDIKIITTGGGIRAFFSAAAYEIVKDTFIEHLPDDLHTMSQKDKEGLEIITTIKVTGEGHLPYTLNWYHTKCSILVNGQGLNKFYDHLQEVSEKIVKNTGTSLTKLSQELVKANEQLRKILTEHLLNEPQRKTEKESTVCPTCHEECRDDQPSALCELKQHWVHNSCDNLSKKEITMIEQEETAYICKSCLPEGKTQAVATIKDAQRLFSRACKSNTLEEEPVVFIAPVLRDILSNINPLSSQDTQEHEPQGDETSTEVIIATSHRRQESDPKPTAQKLHGATSANEILEKLRHEIQKTPSISNSESMEDEIGPIEDSVRTVEFLTENLNESNGESLCPACDKACAEEDQVVDCELCSLILHKQCATIEIKDESQVQLCPECTHEEVIHPEPTPKVQAQQEEATTLSQNTSTVETKKMAKKKANKESSQTVAEKSSKTEEEHTSHSALMKEMRQREMKCKKWELDLKQREAGLSTKLKEVTLLQGIIVKLEQKIGELEKSNKLLRQCSHTQNQEDNEPKPHPTDHSLEARIHYLETKMIQMEMHSMVSSLEDKMSRQMTNIEEKLEKLGNKQPTSYQIPHQLPVPPGVPIFHPPPGSGVPFSQPPPGLVFHHTPGPVFHPPPGPLFYPPPGPVFRPPGLALHQPGSTTNQPTPPASVQKQTLDNEQLHQDKTNKQAASRHTGSFTQSLTSPSRPEPNATLSQNRSAPQEGCCDKDDSRQPTRNVHHQKSQPQKTDKNAGTVNERDWRQPRETDKNAGTANERDWRQLRATNKNSGTTNERDWRQNHNSSRRTSHSYMIPQRRESSSSTPAPSKQEQEALTKAKMQTAVHTPVLQQEPEDTPVDKQQMKEINIPSMIVNQTKNKNKCTTTSSNSKQKKKLKKISKSKNDVDPRMTPSSSFLAKGQRIQRQAK